MEVIQGKVNDKKIVIAQEIAFAKALAGNNKTIRDRAVRKLKAWLQARGNGKWKFTEEEFIRIWTGLFYCMWMSDKFLVQEELAENISQLIHCFKKNSENALLFIKCFSKRILMEWQGLDQYRIDKFHMLVRRILRQSFVYCRRKNWEDDIFKKLMKIFSEEIFRDETNLGYVLHFIHIFPEELAKVGKDKLENKTVLTAIEPFVKLIATTKDERIRMEAENFFMYLMKQTDTGIEFEEKWQAWRKLGYPGTGPDSIQRIELSNGNKSNDESENDMNSDPDEEDPNEPLDPRAGSAHVYLPQIPIDIDSILTIIKNYESLKEGNVKGRKKLRSLSRKFMSLKKGSFPFKIKKDPILAEKKKKNIALKNARKLIEFTEKLDEGPIKTKEFLEMSKQMDEQSDEDEENDDQSDSLNVNEDDDDGGEESGDMSVNEVDDDDDDEEEEEESGNSDVEVDTDENLILSDNGEEEFVGKQEVKSKKCKIKTNNMQTTKSNGTVNKVIVRKENNGKFNKKKKIDSKLIQNGEASNESDTDQLQRKSLKKAKNKLKKAKKKVNSINECLESEKGTVKGVEKKESPKETKRLNGSFEDCSKVTAERLNVTPTKNKGTKRKAISNWHVQELDPDSSEYNKIETQKIIRLEKKMKFLSELDDFPESEEVENFDGDNEWKDEENEETRKAEFIPAFWESAKAKLNKKINSKGNKLNTNLFADINGGLNSPSSRRISFALEKNMAQENEEYLEEVKNSPKVPFDGSKKPIQSALKSALSPSPINPFYKFKKIKF